MNQTKAPESTPSPKPRDAKSQSEVDGIDRPGAVFMSLALDMSWRLALIVLIPLVGGFELDKALKSSPVLTIVGLIVAAVGVALVLKRTLHVVGSLPIKQEKHP